MKEKNVNKIVFSLHCSHLWRAGKNSMMKTVLKILPVYMEEPLMMEQILADYDMACGLKFVALRYFNAAGAHSGKLRDHAQVFNSHGMQVLPGQRDEIASELIIHPTELIIYP